MAVGAGVSPVVDVAPVEEGIVLAVGHDELMKPLGGLHGKAHLRLALHTSPVVGEGRHIGGHGRHVRQLLPQLATGDGAIGQHPDGGIPADQGQLLLQMGQAVRHRVQIGHGTHRGVSAVGGGLGAAGHGLLIRKARLTKMYVYINETGTYHKRRGGNMNGRNTGAVMDFKRENSIPTGENTSAEYLGILKNDGHGHHLRMANFY